MGNKLPIFFLSLFEACKIFLMLKHVADMLLNNPALIAFGIVQVRKFERKY